VLRLVTIISVIGSWAPAYSEPPPRVSAPGLAIPPPSGIASQPGGSMGSAAQLVPDHIADAGKKVARTVARVARPKSLYGRDGPRRAALIENAREEWRESKWTALRLRADLPRLIKGPCQAQFLLSVYFETEGRRPTQDGPVRQYTAVMIPEDFADEGEFTRQPMRKDIEDLLRRGVASSKAIDQGHADPDEPFTLLCEKGASGLDLYRFRLCFEAWRSLPSASIPRKGMQAADEADGGEEEANTQEGRPSRVSEKLLLTKGASGGRPLKPGQYRKLGAAEFRGATLPLSLDNRTPYPLAVRCLLTEDNGICTRVESREAKSRDAEEIRPPAPEPQPSPPRAVRSRKSGSNGDGAGSNGNRDALKLLDQYPQCGAFIMRYPGTDAPFAAKVLAECQASAGAASPVLTDEALFHGLRAVTKKYQESAGLYLSTAPPWVAKWAQEVQRHPTPKPEPTGNPMQAYIRCRDARRVLRDPDANDEQKARARAVLREEGG